MNPAATHVFICRPGYERMLAEELSLSAPGGGAAPVAQPSGDDGVVVVTGGPVLPAELHAPRMFERQRLPAALWLAGSGLDSLADAIAELWTSALAGAPRWTLHTFAPNPDRADSRTVEAQRIAGRLLERLRQAPAAALAGFREPEGQPARRGEGVLQVCRVAGGVWCSFAPFEALSDPYPGGVHRMPQDRHAPSRSYLKIEEALDVMAVSPRPNETVVDLGAAPGGWSYAFLKRGCRVTAVDNGPLKLRSQGDMGGELIHLREDGLRFRPPRPVDWMLSDMLIAPGQALGLLRKWLRGGWARRFVVNLKLPQTDPLVALGPVQAYLAGIPGLRFRLRQLYHDRREVTLMAERSDAEAAQLEAHTAPRPAGGDAVTRTRPRKPRQRQG